MKPFTIEEYASFCRAFLLKHNIMRQFSDNLANLAITKGMHIQDRRTLPHYCMDMYKTDPSRFFLDSFRWVDTKEGHKFWCEINHDFEERYDYFWDETLTHNFHNFNTEHK